MNILLDKLDFDQSWAYETLKTIIKPEHKLCVVPLAFHQDLIKNAEEWQQAYNKLDGQHYGYTVLPFRAYGIEDDSIEVINYFNDSSETAKAKVKQSDIIFLTGGYPDKTMKRLADLDLIETIEHFGGIIMGWSAGAMMQCFDYYISPDEDYPEFIYETGLNCINDFAVEVHYRNVPTQNRSIEKYIKEKGKRVYTTEHNSAIIVEHNEITLLGNAKEYRVL